MTFSHTAPRLPGSQTVVTDADDEDDGCLSVTSLVQCKRQAMMLHVTRETERPKFDPCSHITRARAACELLCAMRGETTLRRSLG